MSIMNQVILDFVNNCQMNEVNPIEMVVEYSNFSGAEIDDMGDVYTGKWWSDDDINDFMAWVDKQESI